MRKNPLLLGDYYLTSLIMIALIMIANCDLYHINCFYLGYHGYHGDGSTGSIMVRYLPNLKNGSMINTDHIFVMAATLANKNYFPRTSRKYIKITSHYYVTILICILVLLIHIGEAY
jgi:hypothetical protein